MSIEYCTRCGNNKIIPNEENCVCTCDAEVKDIADAWGTVGLLGQACVKAGLTEQTLREVPAMLELMKQLVADEKNRWTKNVLSQPYMQAAEARESLKRAGIRL